MRTLETDYLVVGGGLVGMGFTDSLVAHSDADVVIVDRRHRPGGHWNDAYPFVRLHLPSATYGVGSRRLGTDAKQENGPEAGLYERATGAEICDYFQRLLDEDLLPTGRVRFLGLHDYVPGPGGEHRVVSRLTGETVEVNVRRKLVDATYLQTEVPATHTPSFAVGEGARVVPLNALATLREPAERYVVIGAGKTGIDACLWLMDNGVEPGRIRWVRPRDAWLLDRESLQPLDLVAGIVDGLALDLEAAAGAGSTDELFARLEERGRLLRIDPDVTPTMYHCASVSHHELEQLRRITDVVRLGHVVRVDAGTVTFEGGTLPTGPGELFVDCSASGLRKAPPRPIFEPDRVTVQMVQLCTPSFNASLVGFVEAVRDDVDAQNRLCPPNPLPDVPEDWVRMLATTMRAAAEWGQHADVREWLESSRLNLLRGAQDHGDDPRMQAAHQRYAASIVPAIGRMKELAAAR